MKNRKRVFLFIEMILGSMVVVLASLMIREKNGEDLDRVAVIVQMTISGLLFSMVLRWQLKIKSWNFVWSAQEKSSLQMN